MSRQNDRAALRKRVRGGNALLFLGRDVAHSAGYPDLNAFAQSIGITPQARPDGEGTELATADALRLRTNPDFLAHHIGLTYGTSHPLPAELRALQTLPFSGVITTDWTDLAVRAFRGLKAADEFAVSIVEPANVRDAVVHLHGTAAEPTSIALTWDEYQEQIAVDPRRDLFTRSMLTNQSVLFVGMRAEELRHLFRISRVPRQEPGMHFAIVEQRSTNIDDVAMLNRLGVTVLAERNRKAVLELIQTFDEQVAPASQPAPEQRWAASQLVLQDIGPFQNFTVQLGRNVTAFLGDNATGKSTVLRAMALVLSGLSESPSDVGRALLRQGARQGQISLYFGKRRYVTRLWRRGEAVTVESQSLGPVEQGPLLALGFPAVRGVMSERPSGPASLTAADGKADLFPLIAGQPDTRLDDVSQWIVNASVLNPDALEPYFESLEAAMPGLPFRFSDIDPETWTVYLDTTDGRIALDQLSSGMLTVMGWVGLLLDRLRPVGGHPEFGTSRPALVLVDEIDLHLHPGWQRQIVPALRRLFPHVQFVVSTHSPLVVGSLDRRARIIHFHRDDAGIAHAVQVSSAFRGLRADQILTGPAFALNTSMDRETERTLDTYLRTFESGHDAQGSALSQQLAETLGSLLQPQGESESQRRGIALARELIDARLAGLPDDERRHAVAAAAKYFRQLRADQ